MRSCLSGMGNGLVDCMAPIEVDKPNDIEVLIELLTCLLKPGNLGRLSSGICHFQHDVITLQAILRDMLIEISHVEVIPELVLWVVLIGVPLLSIDPFVKEAERDG